jgi:TPR repeat protein
MKKHITIVLFIFYISSCRNDNLSEKQIMECEVPKSQFNDKLNRSGPVFILQEADFSIYLNKSKLGDGSSTLKIAYHLSGQPMVKETIAECWYNLAAEQGDHDEQRALAVFYLNSATKESCKKARYVIDKYDLEQNISLRKSLENCFKYSK